MKKKTPPTETFHADMEKSEVKIAKDAKKLRKKLMKKVKKYDTVGALWFDEDQVRITQDSIFRYINSLFKEKDQRSSNKYYFELELMMKMSDQNSDIEELKEKIKELEKRLPHS